MTLREAGRADADAVWKIMQPIVRGGESYAIPTDFSREESLDYWFLPVHEVWVAEQEGEILGTYYLRANGKGGACHAANCGYMTDIGAGGRGIASQMCLHSLERARQRGFLAMQFNFVIASNERAVRLWEKHGFTTVGRMPRAFLHPHLGFVDALVMHRFL